MNINISTLLDVAIGLIFIFFVFSMFVSGIVELINSLAEQRARLLKIALRKILGSLADGFYEHKLVSVKQDKFWGFNKPINYLSADSFSTVVIDLLTKVKSTQDNQGLELDGKSDFGLDSTGNIPELVFKKIKQVILATNELASNPAPPKISEGANQQDNNPENAYKRDHKAIIELIRPMLVKSNDLETFKAELEKWYNGYMEQVSGWFKRYAQGVVWLVAILITVALNVDTIYLTNRLFNDNGLRDRVVAQAILTAKTGGESFQKDTTFGRYLKQYDTTLVAHDSTQSTSYVVNPKLTGLDSLEVQSAYLRFVQSHVADLALPIGWDLEKEGSPFQAGQAPGLAILGWILTAAALSFGAPFWFDLLLKLVNIRNTARRPPGNPDPNK